MNIEEEEDERQEAVEQQDGHFQHELLNIRTRTKIVGRKYYEGSKKLKRPERSKMLRRLYRSKQLRRAGRSRKLRRPGRSKRLRRPDRSKQLRRPGKSRKLQSSGSSKGTGLGGRVLGNLPRAGAEPQNPGKGGSLSPQVMEGYITGQIFLLWCTLSLTLVSFMRMR